MIKASWYRDDSVLIEFDHTNLNDNRLFSLDEAKELFDGLRQLFKPKSQIDSNVSPVVTNEAMPTNEIHVIGADGKKIVIKF